MLRFNTFRARRYLRSRFVEGAFLLASEAGDIELEIIDLLRQQVEETIGNVAFEEAWKVERLNERQLLIKPGEAWFKGLPIVMRHGKDQLVSGAILSIGSVPVGVTVDDDSTGLGKILTFGTGTNPNNAQVTPTNGYRIVVVAKEELITDVQDTFLKNVNLTESTAQKVRLVYQINIVPESVQDESPIPYRDETSAAGSGVTNYPDVAGDTDPNLQNQIVVNPAPGSGDLISSNVVTGSEGIDGRDLEIILSNPVGANPFPIAPTPQTAFANGKLIDSVGNSFHITRIFNDTVSGRIVFRIDKEFQQVDPQIVNGSPYTVEKAPVYTTDDNNGVPIARLYYPIADLNWNSASGVEDQSDITDLLTRVEKVENFQGQVADKFNLRVTNGGDVSFDAALNALTWAAPFTLVNAAGADQTIAAATAKILEGGSLAYTLDFNGAAIEKGTLAANITTGGTTITVDPITYANVSLGNAIEDSAGTLTYVTAILPNTNQLQVNDALVTGAATIYRDSYAATTAPTGLSQYILAVRKNNKVYVAGLELESGETSQIGDGLSNQILSFMGATGETDSSPDYASEVYITDGDSLVAAISALDAALDALATSVGDIPWKAVSTDFASLPAVGNVDGDVRLVLDTRIAYHWDDAQSLWLPLTGTGAGLKMIGGGTLSVGSSTPTDLSFLAGTFDLALSGPLADRRVGQSITPDNNGTLQSFTAQFRGIEGDAVGNVIAYLREDNAGNPGAIIATSTNSYDITTLTTGYTNVAFTFANPAVSAGTLYFLEVSFENIVDTNAFFQIQRNNADVYASGSRFESSNAGAAYGLNAQDLNFEASFGPSLSLSFTADMFLEKAGLAYSDNTIALASSPIGLPSDKSVAYVTPNLVTGGGALTVNIGTLDEVPLTDLIIARRDGNDIIVGSSSTRLKLGESKELYKGTTDQEEDKIYGIKSSFFRSDNPITWTGSELSFSDDIVLETLKDDGTEQSYTINPTTPSASTPIDIGVGNNAAGGSDDNEHVAQTFTTIDAFDLSQITVSLDGGGTTGNVHMEIWETVGGVPDISNIVAVSASRDITTFVGQAFLSPSDEVFTFAGESLSAGTQYAAVLVIETASALVRVYGDTATTYAGGSLWQSNAPHALGDWTDDAEEVNMLIEGTTGGASLTIANGEYAYLTIDRTLNSATLALTVGTAPSEALAGSEVVILGKRQDVGGVGYLHLPLHKQVLEPGQTVRLGASGSGGGNANGIVESIEDRLCDSLFDLATPVVSELHQEDRLDGASTATYSPVSKSYEFGSIGNQLVTIQMLDALEFLGEDDSLAQVELLAYWNKDNIDTGATYEVSRNGGTEWQAVTMDRIGVSTEVYRGIHTFDEEAANQTLSEEATNNTSLELDGASNTRLAQKITLANKSILRAVDLDLVVNGTPSGNMFVSIVKDSGGVPSTDAADLLTEKAFAVDLLSAGAFSVDITLTLVAGDYHIVVRTDATYKSTFATGATSIELSADSAGPASASTFNGSIWATDTNSFVHTASGIELDLRMRVTGSIAGSALDGLGILYSKTSGSFVEGVREIEYFSFSGEDDTRSFVIGNFTLDVDLLRVYDVNEGKVYRHGAFSVDGNTIVFNDSVFFRPGETVRLIVDQSPGGAFDSSDINGLLLASNHLGSTDGAVDRSVAGRGIFLRRPDGTLRELIVNDSDEIEIYSV